VVHHRHISGSALRRGDNVVATARDPATAIRRLGVSANLLSLQGKLAPWRELAVSTASVSKKSGNGATRLRKPTLMMVKKMSDQTEAAKNKALVQASFDRWQAKTGSPFELLDPGANWTIVGSSPLSKTYANRQAFLEEVIQPFNARMATPLVPTVRGIYADGDMVITLFDAAATAKDGQPYHNTYTWYFRMNDSKVVSATAFFDTREFDEFWNRVSPE
jgi:ketosteroid isomerase-like protein